MTVCPYCQRDTEVTMSPYGRMCRPCAEVETLVIDLAENCSILYAGEIARPRTLAIDLAKVCHDYAVEVNRPREVTE